jgi:cytochrome P450
MLNPKVQKKAQAIIDATIGNDRLPDLSDRGALPYLDAVMYEVLRWKPVAPLGGMYFLCRLHIVDNDHQVFHTPALTMMFTMDISFRKARRCWETYGAHCSQDHNSAQSDDV